MKTSISFQESTASDIPAIVEMESNEDNAAYIFPDTSAQHIALINNDDIKHLMIQAGDTVGFVILAGLDNKHRNIEFRRIVISQKGKGYGRLAIQAVKQLCFGELSCHRLWLDVLETNTRARRLYASEGFKQEGLLRECLLVQGEYQNLIIMSLLAHEYVK